MKRKRCSRQVQQMAVERMRAGEDFVELAKELGVTRRCLYQWRAKLDRGETAEEMAPPHRREASDRKVLRLERLLAQKTLEVDFFKGALQKIEARRQKSGASGETASTTKSES